MQERVKIVNGKTHIMSVEEATRRLSGLRLRVTEREEALGIPFDINFPFACGARSPDDSMIIAVYGTCAALDALQESLA